jgi:methyl farnesoate epoxidase/farnesoate epoxidase
MAQIYSCTGIIWANGEAQKEVRKFTIKNLRDFGFGKSHSMEALIAEELVEFITKLSKTMVENDGKVEFNSRFLVLSSVNVLWSLLTGRRFNHDDETVNAILKTCEKFNETVKLNNVTIPYPFLGPMFPKLSGWADHLKTYEELYAFMEARH